MDPLTALSVAGTIVQFAEFGIKLFADGRNLYQSTTGALTVNEELELVATDLRGLVAKLGRESNSPVLSGPETEDDHRSDETFRGICGDVTKLADELLRNLDKLKVKGNKRRKWESFCKAIQSAWSKKEIQSLTRRLKGFRKTAETHTLFFIREKLIRDSIQISSHFACLDQQTQQIISFLLDRCTKENSMALEIRDDNITTLLDLVRRLDTVNAEEHRTTREMIITPRRTVPKQSSYSVDTITAEIELLGVSRLEETTLRDSVSQKIIRSLQYPAMTNRYESIVEAYPETFEWAFVAPTAEQRQWSDLSHWLKAGDGVYWINGKAGSGKSTLMKHIFDDIRTRKYLKEWAKPKIYGVQSLPLCFATFFFWNSGTEEQKSQLGLIRSLLYQVLEYCPDLVPIAFPDAWATTYSAFTRGRSHELNHFLTLNQLMAAFKAIVHQTNIPLKICFLVDGLDEFDGLHEDIANVFKDMTEACDVKVCLSSRPLVAFSNSFKDCPSLRLQDLTRPDITKYVNGKFGASQAFNSLLTREPISTTELLAEIIDKADGVFLWVHIVVQSLLKGVQNRDEISILHQRLRCMPQELEPLYGHLLGLIEPVYRTWASKAFQIVRAFRDSRLDGSAWPKIRKADGNETSIKISNLHLAICAGLEVHVGTEGVISVLSQISPTISQALTEESLPLKCEDTKVHLTARCAGLLEIPEFEQQGPEATIQFLHRTARDFLENDKNWAEILQHTSKTDFQPDVALSKASILWLAIRCAQSQTTGEEIRDLVYTVMVYAHRVSKQGVDCKIETATMGSLAEIMATWDCMRKSTRKGRETKGRLHWTCRLIESMLPLDWKFVGFATLFGLTGFVGEKLLEAKPKSDGKSFTDVVSQLLHLLFPRGKWSEGVQRVVVPEIRTEMVSLLLSHGANADYVSGMPSNETSAWSNARYSFGEHSPIVKLLAMARRKRRGPDEPSVGVRSPPRKKQRLRKA